jgi:hypothetical protein
MANEAATSAASTRNVHTDIIGWPTTVI